jgi:hypothetical protein
MCALGTFSNTYGADKCRLVVKTKIDCAKTGKYLNETSPNPRDWECEECPVGGWCGTFKQGGVTQDGIEAKFGWHRLQNKTINQPPVFRKCPYPPACMGKPNPEEFGTQYEALWSPLNATEQCNEMLGHAKSFLCAGCLPSYSHSGFTSKVLTCSKCPEHGANALILVVLGLLVFLVIFIMMFLKFRGAKQPKIKAAHSTLKRIVVSHLQVVGVVMALDVPWPQSLQDLIGGVSTTVSLEGRMLSGARCSSVTQDTPDAVTLYHTTMALTVGPIIAAVFTFLYWRFVAFKFKCLACGAVLTLEKVHGQRSNDRRQSNMDRQVTSSLKRRKSIVGEVGQLLQLTPFDAAVATITLLLYLMYPSITAATFSMMKCEFISNTVRPLEAKTWVSDEIVLVYDRDEVCWQGRHLDFTIAVSVPVLILYTIGLPMVGLVVLFRRRQKLDTSQITVFRFGLLYSGYASTRWWWEAVTTIRKVVVVACATILTGDAMQLQVLLGFVFGIIGLNSLGEPFKNGTQVGQELALVEGASLGLLFVTVWSGMFFINFNQDSGGDGGGGGTDTCKGNGYCDFLVFLVILLNILFLILTLRRLFQYFEKRTKIIQKTTRAFKKKMAKKKSPDKNGKHDDDDDDDDDDQQIVLDNETKKTEKTKKKKKKTKKKKKLEIKREIKKKTEIKKRSSNDGDRSNKQRKWSMTNNPAILNLELAPMSRGGEKKVETAAVMDDSINDDEEMNDEAENDTKDTSDKRNSMDEIQIHVDEESGRRFSYDSKIDVSTWLDEDEDAVEEEESNGIEIAGGEEEDGNLDVGVWEKAQDSETGDWYEYHSITEQTRWLEDSEEDAFDFHK